MLRIALNPSRNVLITGGAGLIGANLAAHLLATTDSRITVFDNLSRPGAEANVAWLTTLANAGRLTFLRGDIRSSVGVMQAARMACEIYHLAARCAPPSGTESQSEFDVNVTGTINVLEAARRWGRKPLVLFASTSNVYGPLNAIALTETDARYTPVDPEFQGVSEQATLDCQTAVGCTKRIAERYVQKYARNYCLPTIVFRLDTTGGPRQFPVGAAGWVGRFVDSVLAERPIAIDGEGLHVRDVLHVADLVAAMEAAQAYINVVKGKIYNIGGGMSRSISVNEMVSLVERVCHHPAKVFYTRLNSEGRPFYVSDSSSFSTDTGWMPRRTLEETVRDVAASWYAHRLERATRHSPKDVGSFRQAA